jgi:hypothetical protein
MQALAQLYSFLRNRHAVPESAPDVAHRRRVIARKPLAESRCVLSGASICKNRSWRQSWMNLDEPG